MAYITREKMKKLAPGIRAVLKKYGMKGSIGVRAQNTLVVTLKEGPLNFKTGDYINPRWVRKHYHGTERDFLLELVDAMNDGNHHSLIDFDYFDDGWYIEIRVGSFDQPYVKTEA